MPQTAARPNIIMLSNPDSFISETYRNLRLNIEALSNEREVKTIVITSANRGEGKTTTALNLAVAFAKAGKKVLLVDANLRNPAIREALALQSDQGAGLANVLAGESAAAETIRTSDIDNLFALPSGSASQNPSELLSSERMNALLAEMKDRFDIVLVDAPHVLRLTDAKIMAAKCDGVLLVVDQGKLKREIGLKVKEELNQVNANLLGIVMNRTSGKEA